MKNQRFKHLLEVQFATAFEIFHHHHPTEGSLRRMQEAEAALMEFLDRHGGGVRGAYFLSGDPGICSRDDRGTPGNKGVRGSQRNIAK